MHKPEILSPAGSFESLVAAVHAGCDAVYLGGKHFGARAYASNFDTEELLRAIDYCHIHDVKVYLTVNTVIKEIELNDLLKFIYPFYCEGIDAVIVQDIGAAALIRSAYGSLPIHGSTQMTIHHERGVEFLKTLDFDRVVLSRELNLKEIEAIIQNTAMEVECFVHGALCFAYSGQCLMSSILGGRSANRGRCAGPCRLPYHFVKDDKVIHDKKRYLLSPKDIQTLRLLPDLIDSGIHSFKIEGRMKGPAYVAGVTAIYKKYRDAYILNRESYKVDPEDEKVLLELYNRGSFSTGYYKTSYGKRMMAMTNPKNWGLEVGQVINTDKKRGTVTMQFDEDIHSGDCIEIRPKNKEPISFIVKEYSKSYKPVTLKLKNNTFVSGEKVYRLKNQRLVETIKNSIIQKDMKPNIQCFYSARVSEPFLVKLIYHDIEVFEVGSCVEKAKSLGITRDRLIQQLKKTGNSPFHIESTYGHMDTSIFLPISEINKVRRGAVEKLTQAILDKYRREPHIEFSYKKFIKELDTHSNTGYRENLELRMDVMVRSIEQFNVVKDFLWVDAILIEGEFFNTHEQAMMLQACKKLNKKLYYALPRICRQKKDDICDSMSHAFDGYVIRTYGQLQKFKNNELPLIIDYNMNCFNNMTIRSLKQQGSDRVMLSPELNKKELRQLEHYHTGVLLYGYLPLMVTAQCMIGNAFKRSSTSQEQSYALQDRYGKRFRVDQRDKACYSMIYNTSPTLLLDVMTQLQTMNVTCYRVEFTFEPIEQVHRVMKAVDCCLQQGEITQKEVLDLLSIKDFNRGHFNRGIQ